MPVPRLDSIRLQSEPNFELCGSLGTDFGLRQGAFGDHGSSRSQCRSRWEFTALSALDSILTNAPDALLFVALALLAAEYPRESENNKGSNIHELLQVLIPLHFRQSKEP
jgi:hypothetical protein